MKINKHKVSIVILLIGSIVNLCLVALNLIFDVSINYGYLFVYFIIIILLSLTFKLWDLKEKRDTT